MRLYDFLPSGNGYKVRLTLRWLEIPSSTAKSTS